MEETVASQIGMGIHGEEKAGRCKNKSTVTEPAPIK
jgi:hypothetical protein